MNTKNWFTRSKLSVLMLMMITFMFSCEEEYTYDFVDNSLPSANFSYAVNTLTVSFTNKSNDAITYLWDFGDGTTSDEKSPAAHTYSTKAKYKVTLTAIDGNGISSEYTDEVAVGYPLASFTYFVNKNLVTFTNTSANATDFVWDFGDGTTSTDGATEVKHTFPEAKEYTITLKAINGADENIYSTKLTTTLKLEANIIGWDFNATSVDGWTKRGVSWANSGDSYDIDADPNGKSSKFNFDGNAGAGDDMYQIVDVSSDAEYNLSFYSMQFGTTIGDQAAMQITAETVVDGGATVGTILGIATSKITSNTTSKIWEKFETGNFSTGTNTKIVIRLTYVTANQAAGQVEARGDYVEIK